MSAWLCSRHSSSRLCRQVFANAVLLLLIAVKTLRACYLADRLSASALDRMDARVAVAGFERSETRGE